MYKEIYVDKGQPLNFSYFSVFKGNLRQLVPSHLGLFISISVCVETCYSVNVQVHRGSLQKVNLKCLRQSNS